MLVKLEQEVLSTWLKLQDRRSTLPPVPLLVGMCRSGLNMHGLDSATAPWEWAGEAGCPAGTWQHTDKVKCVQNVEVPDSFCFQIHYL